MKDRVANLTQEEFKTQVESVITKVAEKDYNLFSEHSRFWSEIASHKYMFDRQNREVETLRNLTLEDFKEHFERVFFSPQTKRLDFELNSAKFVDKNEEWKLKNSQTHSKDRIEITHGSFNIFKKQMGLHPDLFKANFATFKL